MHFEDLWNKCESISDKESSTDDLVKNLEMKFAFLKALLLKKESIDESEYASAVNKLFGEVLFSLTQLSFYENINVFKSLNESYNFQNINNLNDKYK